MFRNKEEKENVMGNLQSSGIVERERGDFNVSITD